MKLTHRPTTAIVIALTFFTTVAAQKRDDPKKDDRDDKDPTIIAAIVSVDQTTLFIEGDGFGRAPQVELANIRLGGVQVDGTGRHITALMPALSSGTYLLEVTNKRKTAEFDLTVGAVGPKGDKGDRRHRSDGRERRQRRSGNTGQPGSCRQELPGAAVREGL